MRKIADRNYKTKPHTARFLMAFHTAAYGLPAELADENAAEYALAAGDGAPVDLLDTVDVDAVVDRRTPAQIDFMEDLITDLTELDAEAGRKAREYTDGMTERGLWTPGRWDAETQTGGNTSRWLTNLKAKIKELKAAAPKVAPPATGGEVEIPANNYGINHDGEVKCYQVDYGKEGTRWEGFLFLSRISSADRFPIRNAAEKARSLAAIREDVEAAQILAGLTLRQCRRCHRPLSDTKNPYFSVALGPDCGAM